MGKIGFGLGILLAAIVVTSANAAPFGPFKDDLFSYPQPVASLDGGRRLDVPYDEGRDIDRRDEVPERRVKGAYVDLGKVGRAEEGEFQTPRGLLRFATVGAAASRGPVLVFVHGRNGDRRLGLNDWSFGGNFNRLKNLLVRAGGAYVTVDGGRLGEADAIDIGLLLAQLRERNPGSPLVLACASMGGQICWTVATGKNAGAIDGMVLVGTDSSMERFSAMHAARKADLPILVAHGTRDKVYAFERQLAFFDAVRTRAPSYPVRFVGFDGGNHGTPVRMIDWRETLNWIASEVSPPVVR